MSGFKARRRRPLGRKPDTTPRPADDPLLMAQLNAWIAAHQDEIRGQPCSVCGAPGEQVVTLVHHEAVQRAVGAPPDGPPYWVQVSLAVCCHHCYRAAAQILERRSYVDAGLPWPMDDAS